MCVCAVHVLGVGSRRLSRCRRIYPPSYDDGGAWREKRDLQRLPFAPQNRLLVSSAAPWTAASTPRLRRKSALMTDAVVAADAADATAPLETMPARCKRAPGPPTPSPGLAWRTACGKMYALLAACRFHVGSLVNATDGRMLPHVVVREREVGRVALTATARCPHECVATAMSARAAAPRGRVGVLGSWRPQRRRRGAIPPCSGRASARLRVEQFGGGARAEVLNAIAPSPSRMREDQIVMWNKLLGGRRPRGSWAPRRARERGRRERGVPRGAASGRGLLPDGDPARRRAVAVRDHRDRTPETWDMAHRVARMSCSSCGAAHDAHVVSGSSRSAARRLPPLCSRLSKFARAPSRSTAKPRPHAGRRA